MMKKTTLLLAALLALSVLLSACTPTYSTANEYAGEGDHNFRYYGQSSDTKITEAEDGYYILAGGYVYYADKETMEPVILCNRPNCLHEKETNEEKKELCNAYFPCFMGSGMEYYNGMLYIFSAKSGVKYSLFQVSPDGTEREALFETATSICPFSMAIHRGKVYYTEDAYTLDGSSVYGVMSFDLEKRSAKPEMVYTGTAKKGTIGSILAYGNYIYINEQALPNMVISRYNIENGTVDKPFALPDGTEWSQTLSTIHNNQIHYANWSVFPTSIPGSVEEMVAYTANLDGEEQLRQEQLELRRRQGWLLSDGKYLWHYDDLYGIKKPVEDCVVSVVDSETGSTIASVSIAEMDRISFLIAGGEQHCFYLVMGETHDEIYYADKSGIESDTLEWKLLISKPTPE